MGAVLLELLKGSGYLLLHPLFLLGMVFSVLLGYVRVKKERKHFHVRAQDGWFELRHYFSPLTLVSGLVLSAILLVLGPILPYSWLLVVTVAMGLGVLSFRYEMISVAYTVPLAALGIYLLQQGTTTAVPERFIVENGSFVNWTSLFGLMALLLLIEATAVSKRASKHTSPSQIRSKRGQFVGVHRSKRLWFLPLFFLVPTGAIEGTSLWPILPLGDTNVGIMGIPLVLGFRQLTKTQHAETAVKQTGSKLFIIALVAIISTVAVYFFPTITPYAFGLIVVARASIQLYHQKREKTNHFFYFKQKRGVQILGVIPHSPADKMGIKVGEVVVKVNGVFVRNERDLYEAIQRNAAHCKMEVLDLQGEVRKLQRALYEGEHHQLGVFLLSETKPEYALDVS